MEEILELRVVELRGLEPIASALGWSHRQMQRLKETAIPGIRHDGKAYILTWVQVLRDGQNITAQFRVVATADREAPVRFPVPQGTGGVFFRTISPPMVSGEIKVIVSPGPWLRQETKGRSWAAGAVLSGTVIQMVPSRREG
jgi:hypothetical protein